MTILFDFSNYINSPEELASKVLEVYFKKEIPSYPLDPFKMLDDFGVVYQFRGFKDLEGIYLVPEDEKDIPLAGINIKRPIHRQRFTATHELCHHIKDKGNKHICPIDAKKKDPIEKFADNFAGELLMPINEFRRIANMYVKNGYVNFDDAIIISDYFGVSFESCIFRLAYRLRMIDGDTESSKLKKRIKKYKPDTKRETLGLKGHDIELFRNIINSYVYFFKNESKSVWYKFKNSFIYNEDRLEGIEIEPEEVAIILADLRMKKQESEYCKSEFQNIIEVVGHAAMYDYLINTSETISAFKMINLHRMLFQYAPFPDAAGKTRTTNNLVLSAKFETIDYKDISLAILEVDKRIKELLDKIDSLSVSNYIDEAVKIHHRITVIHPFSDGNGRVSRVMLNWILKLKGLPIVYLKHDKKEQYYDALRKADLEGDYSLLSEVFYKEILNSMMQLNSKFSL